MPGQGYHLGFSKLVAERAGKQFTDEMKIGTLVVDALNSTAGSRRNSHFCGGAGCVFPTYEELKTCSSLQSWDSHLELSYIVDPQIDILAMKLVNQHLTGDYRDGILLHLLADKAYDELVQKKLFDFSEQKNKIAFVKSTGEWISEENFRNAIYSSYPMLDQYLMNLAGITANDVAETKELLRKALSPEHAEFICKYLNYNPNFKWTDTAFFNKETVDALVSDAVFRATMHL